MCRPSLTVMLVIAMSNTNDFCQFEKNIDNRDKKKERNIIYFNKT